MNFQIHGANFNLNINIQSPAQAPLQEVWGRISSFFCSTNTEEAKELLNTILDPTAKNIDDNVRAACFLRLRELSSEPSRDRFEITRADANNGEITFSLLKYVEFTTKNLAKLELAGANLEGANLVDALVDAYLMDANLGSAHLQNADLRGARLHGAHLQNANLQNASLQFADFDGANLEGVDLNRENQGRQGVMRIRNYVRPDDQWPNQDDVCPISQDEFNSDSDPIRVDNAWYERRNLLDWLERGNDSIPHSRRTAAEALLG